MKDVQMPQGGGQNRIPILSALSHCCGMTVVVYLRSSFGYNYFRPRSIFFAVSWAFALFTIYAFNEPAVWSVYHRLCIFGAITIALYWTHFALAFANEWTTNWRHDRYTGKSHIIRILGLFGVQRTLRLEECIHIWAEPALVLLVAAALRFGWNEKPLSQWLVYAAGFLWCKEAINAWFGLRYDKKQKDILDDAAATAEPMAPKVEQGPVKATRKERVKRTRDTAAADETARERRYAEILHLRSSYTLEKAEENYRALIKLEHPDATGDDSTESNSMAAELNAAIEFFREHMSGG